MGLIEVNVLDGILAVYFTSLLDFRQDVLHSAPPEQFY